ncbi:MAG: hypothetical protein U5K37_09610 [Natrialbaceae archaeon]|nr:hypothetical protein [Natrialbaceae archaeon]
MTDRPTVLVPIKVLKGEGIPEGTADMLAHAHVILLGYSVLPEQTPPGQAKMQFEERGERKLREIQSGLEGAGATVERRLVFTHDVPGGRSTGTIYEHGCIGLVTEPVGSVDRVLVAVRGRRLSIGSVQTVSGLFGVDQATDYGLSSVGGGAAD